MVMCDYSKYDESELLFLLHQRDKNAFNELYKRTWNSSFNIAYKRLKDREACKDILHDVYADLWNKCEVKTIDNLLPYLHTAIRYKIYTWLSKGNNTAHFIEPFENMAASSINADSWFELKELEKLITLWMATLPKKRRMVFEMKYIHNLSSKAISQQLNISQKTVQNQLLSSFNELRGHLTHYLVLAIALHFLP
jgi:RNA polymerase sigma factor (sigma-70 family)